MTRILILQDESSWNACLKRSLVGHHEITVTHTTADALRLLRSMEFDAVISRVHMEHDDIFRFLRTVKADPTLATIPVVCFCGIRSRAANIAHGAMERAVRTLQAKAYLALEDFCEGDDCDFEALRAAIETAIDC
ncbi:MAG: hypothetical protein SGJ27_13510 [Candidatus Melainabacteria bacterium]|nr:hypothetical protein [Candidatus Melainabacteria bacterium]